MGTVAENKIAKRNKILDSAYQLFMANSYTATAVDDVVKMAGIAKGTFYLYFKDKYDLLEQIITYKSADLLKDAMGAVDKEVPDGTLKEKTIALSEYIIDFLSEHKDFTALLDKRFAFCFKIFSSGVNPDFSSMINKFLNCFLESGYDENTAKKIIYLITDVIGSVCCDSILGTGPYSMEDIKPILINAISNILEVNENGKQAC